MAGVAALPSLERLYLDGNKIRRVEGLAGLRRLRTLWLNDNRIESLAGIHGTAASESLETLWVARNRVHSLGCSLEGCYRLQELNLADNSIGHFGELATLARLPSLKSLALEDPHFGGNPLCALCNYTPLALHQLRQVHALDSIRLSEEQKAGAEATFLKKRMYYNMRIRTIHRNTSNVLRRAASALGARIRDIRTGARQLLMGWRDLLAGMAAASGLLEAGDEGLAKEAKRQEPRLRSMLRSIEDCVRHRLAAEVRLRSGLDALRSTLRSVSQLHVRRLVLELETGGNIRLEDGRPGELWHDSCVDLVRSRFHSKDFQAIGIKGVRVRRVTRIHNRYLRARFERRKAAIIGADPELAQELGAAGAQGGAGAVAAGGRKGVGGKEG